MFANVFGVVYLLFSVIILSSCALPPKPESLPSWGVSSDEIKLANFVERGIEAFRAGNDEEAVELFRAANALAPDSFPVARNLAVALLHVSGFEEAEHLYSELIAKRPDDPELFFERGNARRGRLLYREALDDYRHAMTMAENNGFPDEFVGTVGRILSDTLLKVGLTTEGRCISEKVVALNLGKEDLRRHARILRSLTLFAKSKELIESRVSEAALKQEPTLLFELALAEFGLGNRQMFEQRRTMALQAAEGDIFLSDQLSSVFLLADPDSDISKIKSASFLSSEALYLPPDLAERWYFLSEANLSEG